MKNFFFCFLFSVLSNGVFGQQFFDSTFILSGKIDYYNDEFIFLEFTDNKNNYKIDSARVTNGKFNFTGLINEPCLATIKKNRTIRDINDSALDVFFLEGPNLTVAINGKNFKNSTYVGSRTDSLYRKNSLIKQPFLEKLKILENKFEISNENEKSKIESSYVRLLRQMEMANIKFIEENPNSYFSLHLLKSLCNKITYKQLKQLYDSTGKKLQNTNLGVLIKKQLDKAFLLDYNQPSPLFSGQDYNGTLISLSNFKGTYVVLDFWASWCAPCRRSFKSLKLEYSKYKGKGLKIITISSDEDDMAWKNAVKKDSLEIWYNLLDTNRLNLINDLYQITELPTRFLVDTKGKIVARYYAGEEEKLYDRLKTVFGSRHEK